jgi:hypothetical protein
MIGLLDFQFLFLAFGACTSAACSSHLSCPDIDLRSLHIHTLHKHAHPAPEDSVKYSDKVRERVALPIYRDARCRRALIPLHGLSMFHHPVKYDRTIQDRRFRCRVINKPSHVHAVLPTTRFRYDGRVCCKARLPNIEFQGPECLPEIATVQRPNPATAFFRGSRIPDLDLV